MRQRRRGGAGVVALVLLIALVVGVLGYASNGFREWNVENWFKGAEELPPEDVEKNGGVTSKDSGDGTDPWHCDNKNCMSIIDNITMSGSAVLTIKKI